MQKSTGTRNLTQLSQVLKMKRTDKYNQRIIEVERGSFSPLMFSLYGGTCREADRFMTELADKLAEKKNIDYSTIIHCLRAKLSFNLLKSAVMCLTGSKRSKHELTMDLNGVEISKAIGQIIKYYCTLQSAEVLYVFYYCTVCFSLNPIRFSIRPIRFSIRPIPVIAVYLHPTLDVR